MSIPEKSREDEVRDASFSRPHVVILGAGASMACVPQGDRHGKRLPDMAGLAAIEEIRALLIEAGADSPERDFEVAYAAIRADDSMREIADQVDLAVRKYFSDIEIVDRPTIYDHLLLGLRGKDLIATFNWDPLIIQAYRRLARLGSTNLPHLVFLHGNVALGTCRDDNETGVLYARCRVCGNHLEPVPLLYPVTEKNYEADDFIAGSWAALRQELERAALVTVFGYRAPDSDVAAMTEFKRALGTADRRQFEQFELIGRPGADPEALRGHLEGLHSHAPL
jgi:hypothetical protein